MIKNFLNPERHQNLISGSKVTAILMKGWILPVCGASSEEGLRLQPLQHACLKISSKFYHGYFLRNISHFAFCSFIYPMNFVKLSSQCRPNLSPLPILVEGQYKLF